MSEENTGVQESMTSESTTEETTTPDLTTIMAEKDRQIEELKNMVKGLDRRVTQVTKEKEEKDKIISEKEQVKKTVEQQIQDLQNQLNEKDRLEKQQAKESLVNRIIAETKLDPKFDFDYLKKYETEDLIKEKALERAEYYNKLKEDGFKERASGSIPKKGSAMPQDLSTLGYDELNALIQEKPEMKAQILEAVAKKSRGN